ncbi:hypothetical protein TSOC_012789, partial [Tetrabaena socialis]
MSAVGVSVAGCHGAISRLQLSSPITLRDLVLYNLAPGGTYPLPGVSEDGSVEALTPAPQLQGADAPWVNSSLPLWYFQCARSAEELQQLVLAAGGEASTEPAPRLVLSKVTLVVPEAEWRALAAAVLLQHAPAAMKAAQQQQQQQRVTLQPILQPPPQLRRRQAMVASYSYASGVLLLSEARWYGVYGMDVTVSYTLPDDAPPGAALLSYPPLVLPYQELADLNIDIEVDFSLPPPSAPSQRTPPDLATTSPPTPAMAQPAPARPLGSDPINTPIGDSAAGRGSTGLPQQHQHQQQSSGGDGLPGEGPPGGGSGGAKPAWRVPVAATVSIGPLASLTDDSGIGGSNTAGSAAAMSFTVTTTTTARALSQTSTGIPAGTVGVAAMGGPAEEGVAGAAGSQGSVTALRSAPQQFSGATASTHAP